MTIREYAKSVGFEIVGKLKRMPDVQCGMYGEKHYQLWVDDAGNEYCGGSDYVGYCIITADGGVI